jgi:hypothetical protein
MSTNSVGQKNVAFESDVTWTGEQLLAIADNSTLISSADGIHGLKLPPSPAWSKAVFYSITGYAYWRGWRDNFVSRELIQLENKNGIFLV